MNSLVSAVASTSAGAQGVSALSAGALVEMLLWLAVVVAFILVCAWAYRRLSGGMLSVPGAIRVRSVISVGNRERIALIEVGDKQLLVGVCPGQINTLHVFDEPVLPAQGEGEPGAFASKLQSLLNKDVNS